MKRKRGILLILLGVCAALLTACSPILKTFDPFNVQLDYRVPEKRKDTNPDMEIEAQLKKLIATVDRNKYDAVDGDDAYYLLPTGTPLPEGLIDFQSVGMLDENTTCYAYQALYAKDDENGLDDMPLEGKATPFDDIQESPDNLHYMVTFLMTYNTKTKTYRVLYHAIEEVVASYVVLGEDENEKEDERVTAKRLRVSKASALPNGKKATDNLTSEEIAALPLCEKIYLRKLNKDSFWFYHEGYGYRYNLNGELQLKQNLNSYLQQVTYRYGPRGLFKTQESGNLSDAIQRIWLKAGDVYTISDIVVDENGFIYLHLCMTKKEFNIRKGVKKEDIGDPGDNMTQIYCRICSVDIGSYKTENGEEKNSFRSQNKNYQNAVDAWMKADGQVFTFDQKPTESMLVKAVGTEAGIKKDYPETYGSFQFSRAQFPVELQVGKMSILRDKEGDSYAIVGDPVNPQKLADLLNHKNSLDQIDIGWFGNQKEIRNLFVKLAGQYFIFEKTVFPEIPSAVNRVHTRTFTVEYTVTETGENGEKVEHTREREITQTAIFTEALETVFPSGTNVYFGVETENDASLTQSSGGGVLEYTQSHFDFQTGKVSTNDTVNLDETKISWKSLTMYNSLTQQNWMQNQAEDITIPDTLQKILMVPAVDTPMASPLMVASGQKGIYFGDAINTPGASLKQWSMSGIPYAEMLKEEATQVSGYNYDASRVLYFYGRKALYLASPDTGIMKVNIMLGDSYDKLKSPGQAVGRISQVSPYPSFAIYSDESGSINREIAFQTTAYTYEETDQFRAKIYTVPLADEEAELNQISFVIDVNKTLQRTLLTEMNYSEAGSVNLSSFAKVLQNMGVKNAGASHIQSYRAYLVREMSKRIAARKQIGRLAGIPETDAFSIYAFDFFHTMTGEIQSSEELENLIFSLRMARHALQGQQVSAREVTQEMDFSGESGQEKLNRIVAKLNVDFSALGFEQFFFSQNATLANTRYRRGYLSGEQFLHIFPYSGRRLYQRDSKDRGEIAKVAAYISMYEDIQSRILQGDSAVWTEIYAACSLNKAAIRKRNQNDNPKMRSIEDYENYIRSKAELYRNAREEILDYAGMPAQNSEAIELSPEETAQANARTFFRGLLEKDLPMQEEELVNGSSVEKLIASLCRNWSGMEDIESKSDSQISKMQQEAGGYSDRVWKRMLGELKTDLQPDFSRTGYDNRGNFDVRRIADYMEDSWYQAKEEEQNIKNAGELLLADLKKSTESSENAEPSGSAWKLVLVNAGVGEQANADRLTDYYRYLLLEVQERQSVSLTLQKLSGYRLPQTMNIEEQYDRCKSADDVENLLCMLYSERPDVKRLFTGTTEGSEEQETPSMQDMAERMRTQNDLTKEQWTRQMETLLSQMQIQLDYETFLSQDKSRKEQKALAAMLERRTKREGEVKQYQKYKEGYKIATRWLRWDLSVAVYEKEDKQHPGYTGSELDIMNQLTDYIVNDTTVQIRLGSGPWHSGGTYSSWITFFNRIRNREYALAMIYGRYNAISPALVSYMKFCHEKCTDRYQDYKKLLKLFEVDATEVTDPTQFCLQIRSEAIEWRKTH